VNNPFEAHAGRVMNEPQRRRAEKAERQAAKNRPPTALEVKQAEDAILAKLYRDYRRALKAEIAAANDPHFKKLESLLRNLSWSDADAIVDHVFTSGWLTHADDDTKTATLGYIDASFCRARTRHGLAPIDDGLPGEPLQPFVKVRFLLFGY